MDLIFIHMRIKRVLNIVKNEIVLAHKDDDVVPYFDDEGNLRDDDGMHNDKDDIEV